MQLNQLGKVYVLNFPFTDASGSKDRPTAIIIEEEDDVEVLYITSKNVPNSVKITGADFIDGWLDHDSYIKVSKSIPYSKQLFTQENYQWTLSKEKMEEVVSRIVAKYQIILEEIRQM